MSASSGSSEDALTPLRKKSNLIPLLSFKFSPLKYKICVLYSFVLGFLFIYEFRIPNAKFNIMRPSLETFDGHTRILSVAEIQFPSKAEAEIQFPSKASSPQLLDLSRSSHERVFTMKPWVTPIDPVHTPAPIVKNSPNNESENLNSPAIKTKIPIPIQHSEGTSTTATIEVGRLRNHIDLDLNSKDAIWKGDATIISKEIEDWTSNVNQTLDINVNSPDINLKSQASLDQSKLDSAKEILIEGHWEYFQQPPIHNNLKMWCDSNSRFPIAIETDCANVQQHCDPNLHTWRHDWHKNGTHFDSNKFCSDMQGKRILLIGSSLVRNILEDLYFSLGWMTNSDNFEVRRDLVDEKRTIVCAKTCGVDVCYLISTFFFLDRNTTDKECCTHASMNKDWTAEQWEDRIGDWLLEDKTIDKINEFDKVFIMSYSWWVGRLHVMCCDNSQEYLFEQYKKSMEYLFQHVKTELIYIIGHHAQPCQNKHVTEPLKEYTTFKYHFQDLSLELMDPVTKSARQYANVRVLNAAKTLSLNAQAHPYKKKDCLHFCLGSAALHFYLDLMQFYFLRK